MDLTCPKSSCSKVRVNEIPGKQVKEALKKSVISKFKSEVEEQKWEGKILASRWKEEDLDKRCFVWVINLTTVPTHMITGV